MPAEQTPACLRDVGRHAAWPVPLVNQGVVEGLPPPQAELVHAHELQDTRTGQLLQPSAALRSRAEHAP